MPRKSAAALEVAPSVVRAMPQRPRPPAGLSAAERRVWRAVVEASPADRFRGEHLGQLVALCQHRAMADELHRRLQTLDFASPEFARVSAAQISHSKAALAYERSLRLTLQAQQDKKTAATAAAKPRPLSYEELRHMYSAPDIDDEPNQE